MVKQIEITRVFDASIEIVWQVWVDPELVKRWWGPKQFTSPTAVIDFREGGKSLVSMQAPKEIGGQIYYSIWEYQKIVSFKSIEFIQSLSDKKGVKIDPEKVGMPSDFPREIKTIVTFKQLSDNKTQMTVTEYADFGTISNFAQIGLEQSFEKIALIFR